MQEETNRDFTNDEILRGIRMGSSEIFRHIQITTFSHLENFITKNKGTKAQAKEIFQEALIVVFKKIRNGPIVIDCKFSTFFIGICKIIWKYNHKNDNHVSLGSVDVIENTEEIEDLYMESREFRLYMKHFSNLSERKQNIFQASLSNKPYNEIYKAFGFKSTSVLKNKIARIKKQLIQNITSDPDFISFSNRKRWKI